MITEFEKRYNGLRSAFDLHRKALNDVLMTLEEVKKDIADDALKTALGIAIERQEKAIKEIGLKCGYTA